MLGHSHETSHKKDTARKARHSRRWVTCFHDRSSRQDNRPTWREVHSPLRIQVRLLELPSQAAVPRRSQERPKEAPESPSESRARFPRYRASDNAAEILAGHTPPTSEAPEAQQPGQPSRPRDLLLGRHAVKTVRQVYPGAQEAGCRLRVVYLSLGFVRRRQPY